MVLSVDYQCSVDAYCPTQHITAHFTDDFYRPDDQTNSVKALKETSWSSTINISTKGHF